MISICMKPTRFIRPRIMAIAWVASASASAATPDGPAGTSGFDPARIARIDDAIMRTIAAKAVPGAVVAVGRKGKPTLVKAFGDKARVPGVEPMAVDTAFDMASLTKPMATATSIMLLIERGRLRPSDTLKTLLPEFDNKGKGAITVDQLLRHRAGLIADNPIGDFADGPARAWERMAQLDLVAPPGSRFLYSDVGYMILGRVVEVVSGMPLDAFAKSNIFGPLGMTHTGFRPVAADNGSAEAIAPTEPGSPGGAMLRGVVHDPRARRLGGVAGHAGLFSTAGDVATFARMMLEGGKSGATRILAPLTVRAMVDPADTPPGQRRGLGWDVDTSFSTPRGALFPGPGFGHTGFTGTSLWVDLQTETFVILLTSRLHPDGTGASPTALRAEVSTLAAAAIDDASSRPERTIPALAPASRPPDRPAIRPVACGVDILARGGFAELRGKRVGLVTNHTGRLRDGSTTIDAIFRAPEVRLVALFSPEHGIRGAVDAEVDDGRDEATGLPVFSLYGKTRSPTPESLAGLDVLVYDIQDIGARFYTYISTLGLVLDAAGRAGLPLTVLDRPNPIGGVAVSGPVRDPQFASFIAHHAMPVRHGMTVGEIARMFNAERDKPADLRVVACEGWRRADLFDRTGLPWVNPSPNMRSLTEAFLYPGVGLLEGTNLATGRGTDTPFERVGAPYIDPVAFASALNNLGLAGVGFVPIRFTPRERQFAGQECGGVSIFISDWSSFDPIDLGLGLATVLRAAYREAWKPEALERFIADEAAYRAILAGASIAEVKAVWKAELDEFAAYRSRFLLYP